jgi:hypothetical protein
MKLTLTCAVFLILTLPLVACETTTEVVRPSRSNNNTLAEVNAFLGPRSSSDVFSTPAPRGRAQRPTAAAQPAASELPATALEEPTSDWDDPCFNNLDELAGVLLAYYRDHKSFPPTLDQIPTTSLTGEKISLTCPVTGKRYVYRPEGIRPPLFIDQNDNPRAAGILVLYDPQPSHTTVLHFTKDGNDYDAKRPVHYGIIVLPAGASPNQPMQVCPERIEPGILDMYLKNDQKPAPAARPATSVW